MTLSPLSTGLRILLQLGSPWLRIPNPVFERVILDLPYAHH